MKILSLAMMLMVVMSVGGQPPSRIPRGMVGQVKNAQDVVWMNFQVGQYWNLKEKAVLVGMGVDDPKARYGATMVAGLKGMPVMYELVDSLIDDDPYVRQAGRNGLVILSGRMISDYNKTKDRKDKMVQPFMDFGPPWRDSGIRVKKIKLGDGRYVDKEGWDAQELWSAWLSEMPLPKGVKKRAH